MSINEANLYLQNNFKNVEGWCIPHLFQLISGIDLFHQSIGFNAPVAEIGVYHGKFFIGLIKTKLNQGFHLAIDVFDMQKFNKDGAGIGSLKKLKENIQLCGLDANNIKLMTADSTALKLRDLMNISEVHGYFSLFSVDGCHTAEHTVNDFKIACQLTSEKGCIFVDDYTNSDWPGVEEGICKYYLTDSPTFVPLAVTCNKLITCHLGYHNEYIAYLLNFYSKSFPDVRIKKVKRFGYDTLTIHTNISSLKYIPS